MTFAQILVNSIAAATSYWLIALSFGMGYRINSFFDMSLGGIYTVGAYLAFSTAASSFAGVLIATSIGVAASIVIGMAIHRLVFRSRVLQKSQPGERFLVSLGTIVAIQSVIAIVFGNDTKLFAWRIGPPLRFGGLSVTRIQITTIVCALTIGVLFILVERYTKAGLVFRAVACDRELASIHGAPVGSVQLATAAVSAGIAGLAGIVAGTDVGLTPGMGFRAILLGMVAAIVGGVAGFEGLMIGALLVALLQNFAAYWLSSTWQDGIVFLLLVVSLLIRPQGVVGVHFRRTAV